MKKVRIEIKGKNGRSYIKINKMFYACYTYGLYVENFIREQEAIDWINQKF